MSGPSVAPSTNEWVKLKQVVERFEAAWRRGDRPAIGGYVLEGGEERRLLLAELVLTELRLRIVAGEGARVEAYLHQHPELAEEPDLLLDLIAAEYALTRRR